MNTLELSKLHTRTSNCPLKHLTTLNLSWHNTIHLGFSLTVIPKRQITIKMRTFSNAVAPFMCTCFVIGSNGFIVDHKHSLNYNKVSLWMTVVTYIIRICIKKYLAAFDIFCHYFNLSSVGLFIQTFAQVFSYVLHATLVGDFCFDAPFTSRKSIKRAQYLI